MKMLKLNGSVSTNNVKPEALPARSISLIRSSCFFRSIFDWNTRRSLLTILSSWNLPHSSGCADQKTCFIASLLLRTVEKTSGECSCWRDSAFWFIASLATKLLTTGTPEKPQKLWSFTGEHHISHNSRWVLLGTKQCSNQAWSNQYPGLLKFLTMIHHVVWNIGQYTRPCHALYTSL